MQHPEVVRAPTRVLTIIVYVHEVRVGHGECQIFVCESGSLTRFSFARFVHLCYGGIGRTATTRRRRGRGRSVFAAPVVLAPSLVPVLAEVVPSHLQQSGHRVKAAQRSAFLHPSTEGPKRFCTVRN